VVARVPGYGPHTEPGILRCSIADDEAIVVENIMATVTEVVTVSLSTGGVRNPSWAQSNPPAREIIAVSGSGRYALRSAESGSEIVDTQTDAVAARIPGQPRDISWDGHLVVVTAAGSTTLNVVDWRTGATIWRSTPVTNPNFQPVANEAISARPHSDDIALAVWNQPGQQQREAALWLIKPGTTPTLLARRVLFGVI
jgi:hypothetical protein